MKNNRISGYYNNNNYFGAAIITLFSVVFLLLEIYNGRFWQSDFTVYYRSAERLLSGLNLFGYEEDGHYVFKYSPVSAFYFIPFTSLPYEVAKVVYWFFYTGIIISGFYLATFLSIPVNQKNNTKLLNKTVLLGALILVVHFQRELHLGQVNEILLLSYLLTAYFFRKRNRVMPGLLIASGIFIKPFGLIFIPYFLVKGRYKELIYTVLFMIIIFFIPLIFYPFDEFIRQNSLWMNELAIELSNKQGLLMSSNHTIFSVIARYTPLRFLEFTPVISSVYQITMLGLIGIMVLIFVRKGRGVPQNETAEFALLISLIPMLSFTSHNAFGFAALAVFYILYNFKSLNITWKITSITGFVLLGGNFNDIWGSSLSSFFNDISLVTIGAILLVIVLFNLRFKRKII